MQWTFARNRLFRVGQREECLLQRQGETMPAHVSVDLPEFKGRIKGTRPESAMDEHKKMRAEIGGGGADSDDSDDGAQIPAMDSKAEAKKRRGTLIRQRMVGDARITVFFVCKVARFDLFTAATTQAHTAIFLSTGSPRKCAQPQNCSCF